MMVSLILLLHFFVVILTPKKFLAECYFLTSLSLSLSHSPQRGGYGRGGGGATQGLGAP